MTKTVDDYRAFEDINFSNARSENESFEDYRKRLKQNKQIMFLIFEIIENRKLINMFSKK